LSEAEYQILKSTGFAIALGLAVLLQRLRPHRPLKGSWPANAGLAAFNAIVLGVVCLGCACAVSRWAGHYGFGLLNQSTPPLWLAIAVSVVGIDAIAYLWHRANHAAPLLWRFHRAHHSDPTFTATTALRFHPGELLLALPLRLLTVAALGVPIVGVIVFEVVFAFSNFLEHGNIQLGPRLEQTLALVFVTPAIHRWHHGRGRSQLDSNYATIFSFWDRLFGTFVDARSEVRVDTGLPGMDERLDTLGILRLPVAGASGPSQQQE
jgi:sterol desaturase/sphingolipid hydroxylase (fatty acid hydroxylase superfamily)